MPVGRRPLPLGPPLEGASAAMHEAARKGNAGGITRAIRKGADMESLDPKLGETVLMLSARHCDVKNVEVLLKAGASLSTRSVERYTAMHTACLGGNTSIVQRLIKEGAGVSCRTKFGDTPLISGALKGHGGAVELLLEAGADVNAFDLEGRTGLMWAATHGQAAMVSLLLAAGAKHNLRDDKGAQALHNATEHQQLGAIAALLRAGANPNSGRRSDQESPLHMTVRRKLSKAARVLLHGGALADVKDGTGMTPLHCAASDGSTEMVSLILGYIRRRDVDDALCSEGHGPGVADNASTAGQRSRRQQQQEYRGDESSAGPGMRQVLTARNDQGWTALHIAAMVYNVDIVNLLLRHGALETERDRIGETPFLYPVRCIQNDPIPVILNDKRLVPDVFGSYDIILSLSRARAARARSWLLPASGSGFAGAVVAGKAAARRKHAVAAVRVVRVTDSRRSSVFLRAACRYVQAKGRVVLEGGKVVVPPRKPRRNRVETGRQLAVV